MSFTDQQSQFIIENCTEMSVGRMARKLGKSYQTVYQHIKLKNLAFKVVKPRGVRVKKVEVLEQEIFNVDKLKGDKTWII